jgi:hypothetical protein
MVKISLIFVTLLSGIVVSSANAYNNSNCNYRWTMDCERMAAQEQRDFQEQMLRQMEEQNRIMETQLENQERARRNQEIWQLAE